MMTLAPTHDSVLACAARALNPGYGYCFRCGHPWNRVKEHNTNYSDTEGCFPLCEICWTILGSPEARIEYYGMLVSHWETIGGPVTEDTKLAIQRAVANGG